jgi:multidrug efflux pump subunit AcrA (membrane-fusion protein)
MNTSTVDLKGLAVARARTHGDLIRPPRRWGTRVLLPLVLLAGFGGLAVWSVWDSVVPGLPVSVVPVLARTEIVESPNTELFTATGWLEPGPTPIEVPALAEGVVAELLVLPGQRVAAGQAIAKLIDVDAQLVLQSVEQELAQKRLKIKTAQADLAEAEAQARGAEAAVRADAELLKNKVIGQTRYDQTLAQRDVTLAKIDQARARLQEAEAEIKRAEVMVAMAQLRLDRTTVRTPVAGIVMLLNASPGKMVGAPNPLMSQNQGLVTLYDPETLQVRVEVPIDKFQHVQPGQPAELELDVCPGQRLSGLVLYDTHETDIQRNTVRVKLKILHMPPASLRCPVACLGGGTQIAESLLDCAFAAWDVQAGPRARLRPGMIAKVRMLAPAKAGNHDEGGAVQRVIIPRRLLVTDSGKSTVWVVDQAQRRAELHEVRVGRVLQENVEIVEGLQPSDKLITSGRESLQPGCRVRIVAEGE